MRVHLLVPDVCPSCRAYETAAAAATTTAATTTTVSSLQGGCFMILGAISTQMGFHCVSRARCFLSTLVFTDFLTTCAGAGGAGGAGAGAQ